MKWLIDYSAITLSQAGAQRLWLACARSASCKRVRFLRAPSTFIGAAVDRSAMQMSPNSYEWPSRPHLLTIRVPFERKPRVCGINWFFDMLDLFAPAIVQSLAKNSVGNGLSLRS